MAKPRRKHPLFRAYVESSAGRAFDAILRAAVGHGRSYRPIAYAGRERAHHFRLTGSVGAAELIEHAWTRVDETFVADVEMRQRRWTLEGSGMYVARLVLNRPSPETYQAAGRPGAPAGLTKADQDGWWAAERARIGDERDVLTAAFLPDEFSLPLLPDHGDTAEVAVFACAACPRRAGVVAYAPPGIDFPGRLADDSLDAERIAVAFGEDVHHFVVIFDAEAVPAVRRTIGEHDPSIVGSLQPWFTPFWCEVCDECYCAEDWSVAGRDRLCPEGHVRSGSGVGIDLM